MGTVPLLLLLLLPPLLLPLLEQNMVYADALKHFSVTTIHGPQSTVTSQHCAMPRRKLHVSIVDVAHRAC